MSFDNIFLSAKVGSVINVKAPSLLVRKRYSVTGSKYGKSRYTHERMYMSWAPFRIKRSRGALIINDRREEGTQVREAG